MESGLGFPRRQEGGCVSPEAVVRERATSSHGMVREGSHTHWALEEKAVLRAQTLELNSHHLVQCYKIGMALGLRAPDAAYGG